MASRKIEADVVVKVTGADDVEEVAEAVRELSDQTSNVRVEVDGEEQVERLNREFEDLDNVTVTATAKVANQRSIEDFIRNVRDLDGETATAVLAVRAAQAEADLREIIVTLGDVNSTQAQIDIATDRLPQAKADLVELRDAIVDIGDAPPPRAFEQLGESASQAGSIISNTVGNSVQDLASLGGAAGSATQSIGQLAEMFTEAAMSGKGISAAFESMSAALGPILAITVAVSALGSIFEAQGDKADRSAELTKLFGDAMRSAGDDTLNMADSLRENISVMQDFDADARTALGGFVEGVAQAIRDVPILGGIIGDAGQNITDVAAAFDKAGVSAYELASGFERGAVGTGALIEVMRIAKDAGKITAAEFAGAEQALNAYGDAAERAKGQQALFNVNQAEANALLEDLTNQADPLAQMADTWATLFSDMADGSIDTKAAADAINLLSTELGLTQEQVVELARSHLSDELKAQGEAAQEAADKQGELVDALGDVNDAFAGTEQIVAAAGRAFDQFNRGSDLNFADMASDTVASFDDLKAALSEVQDIGSKPLAPTTVEGLRGLSEESAAVIDALGGMRSTIQTELSAALEDSGGNLDAFRSKAEFFRGEIDTQFRDLFLGMGLSAEEADAKVTEVLGNLGLLPSQTETQIRITQEQEALAKIEMFGSALDNLPPEVLAQVTATVDEDPVAAWNLIDSEIQKQGAVSVPSAMDTTGAWDDATSFAKDVEGTTVTAPLDADASEAKSQRDDFLRATERSKPIVSIASDVQSAILTLQLIRFAAAVLSPVVTVTAETWPAMVALGAVANQRPRVPVTAYLADYPSASEIQRAIGRPRIPVDIVVGSSIRITGVRD